MDKPRFGAVIKGIHASDSNPHQYGYYVETIIRKGALNSGRFYRCTDGNGDFWEYPITATEIIESSGVKGSLTNPDE